MTTTVPEWLARRGGGLKQASDGKSLFVLVNGDPLVTLVPRPVADKHGCYIKLTNSGKPIPSTSASPTESEAIGAALEELRSNLGW
jgi:hypothetical protein